MQREIFEFEINGKTLRVDPLLVHFALLDDPEFELQRDAVTLNALATQQSDWQTDRDSRESVGRISRAVRRAFGLQAFDGEAGVTIEESLALLFEFLHWQATVKKKHRIFCDVASVYGCDLYGIEGNDYERYVALVLLADRAGRRQANYQRRAFEAALGQFFGSGHLSDDWFDAIARNPAHAEYLKGKHETLRSFERASQG